MRSWLTIALLLGSALCLAQTYEVVELAGLGRALHPGNGTLGPDGTVAITRDASPAYRAATWRNGVVSEYTGFGTNDTFGGESQGAEFVVGSARNDEGHLRAAFWQNGNFSDIGSTYRQTSASAINASHVLGGSMETAIPAPGPGNNFYWHAFIYENGALLDLGVSRTNRPNATINALSDVGLAVGYDYNPFDVPGYDSFVWSSSLGKQYLNGPVQWAARDVNTAGQIIGNQYAGPAFLRQSDGTFVNLGDGTSVVAINDSGDIVGSSQAVGGPAIWQGGGTPVNLNTLVPAGTGLITNVIDINDAGQILVAIDAGSSSWRQVLLNPVPEPSTLVALIAACAFVALRRVLNAKFISWLRPFS